MCDSPLRVSVPNLFAGSPPASPEKFNGVGVVEDPEKFDREFEETTQETSIFSDLSTDSDEKFEAPPLPKVDAGLVNMANAKKRVFRNLCQTESGTIAFVVKPQVDTAEQAKRKRPAHVCYRPGLQWRFDQKKKIDDFVFYGSDLPKQFTEALMKIIQPPPPKSALTPALRRESPLPVPDASDRKLTPIKTQLFCIACHSQPVKEAHSLCDSFLCQKEPDGAEYLTIFEDRHGVEQTKRSIMGFSNVLGELRARRQARIVSLLKRMRAETLVVIQVNGLMAPMPAAQFVASQPVIFEPVDIAHRRGFGDYERIVRVPNSFACENLVRRIVAVTRSDAVVDFGPFLLSSEIEWYGVPRFVVRQFIHSEKEGGAIVASTF